MQAKEQQQAWLVRSIEGLNVLAFELFAFECYPKQFELYRQFRRFKDPNDAHAVDSAFARAHNEKTRHANARLFPIERSYIFPFLPDDLFNWSVKNKLYPTPSPMLQKVKIVGFKVKSTTLESLQTWLDQIQLFLFYKQSEYLKESGRFNEQQAPSIKAKEVI